MRKKWMTAVLFAIIGAAFVILVCTFFGAADVNMKDTMIILLNKMTGAFQADAEAFGPKATIIWNLRFPRTLLAFIIGGALAVCGGVYQAIFKNPMADPFVLGISSGAAFGATIGIMLHVPAKIIGISTVSIFAFGGALLAIFLYITLPEWEDRQIPHRFCSAVLQ